MGSALDRLNKLGIKDYAPGEIGIKTPQPTKAAITPVTPAAKTKTSGIMDLFKSGIGDADVDFGTVYAPISTPKTNSRVENTMSAGVKQWASGMGKTVASLFDTSGAEQAGDDLDTIFGTGTGNKIHPVKAAVKVNTAISNKAGKYADEQSKSASEYDAAARQGLGTFGNLLVSAGESATQMALDFGTTGGKGTLASMGTRSFGSHLQEAEAEGASKDDATNYAIGAAAIDVLTEKISSIAAPFTKMFGKGVLDGLSDRLIDIAKTQTGRAALKTILSAGGEGLEEVIADALNPVIREQTISKGASYGKLFDAKQAVQDGLVGAIMGLAGGATEIPGAAKADLDANKLNGYASFKPMTPQEQAAHDKVLELNRASNPAQQGKKFSPADYIINAATGKSTPTQNAQNAPQATQAAESVITPPQEQNAPTVERGAHSEAIQPIQPEVNTTQSANVASTLQVGDTITLPSGLLGEVTSRDENSITFGFDNGGKATVKLDGSVGSALLNQINSGEAKVKKSDGLGAADKGFATTPYTEWMNNTNEGGFHPISDTAAQNVVEQQSRAPMEIPKQDTNGGLTSKQVSTIVNSGITPDDFASALANDASTGKFSHMAYSDADAVHKAEQNILGKSWDVAYTEYKDAVNDGKVSKDITATGIVLYNNAVTSGDYAKAMDIASLMIQNSTSVGQSLQAMNLLNKLSPEGKLYMAQKAVDDINERVKAASENTPKTRKARKQSQEIADETGGEIVKRVRKAAKSNGPQPQTSKPGNIPVEDWNAKTAELLANKIDEDGTIKKSKSRTTMQTILSDLVNFADANTRTAKAKSRTGLDRITDYVGNDSFYDEAWEAAQQAITEKYADDPAALDAYSDFLASTASESAADSLSRKGRVITKPQQKTIEQKFKEALNTGGFSKPAIADALTKYAFGADAEITVDPDLMQAYKEALDSGKQKDIDEAWRNIEQNVADQIPSDWKEKLNAWRYLAMLGNPHTHIRNIVGNAGFMPVRVMKNALATGIERVTLGRAGEGGGRTKALLNVAIASDRALLNAGWLDYDNMEGLIQSGGKFNDTASEIDNMRTIYGFKPLETLRKANNTALDKEDTWFSRPAYATSLASYLKANGIDAQAFLDGTISDDAKTAAQNYAVKEAQKATYRDTNDFSKFVSRLGKSYDGKSKTGKVANTIIEGVLPFKKTPANILVRGVEYSPLEFIKVLGSDISQVKSGTMKPAEMIDHISSGLTGTGLLGLGIYLASQGLISGGGSGDDKQDNFKKLQGQQDYALSIGDKNYTMDWLAPEALPMFVGVEMYNRMADGGANTTSVWDAATRIASPVLDMSMLSGVNDVIDSVSYAESSDKLWAVAASAATSYLSQFIPTLGGQIERTFTEDQRETTLTNKESGLPSDMQYAIAKAANKIPGVDYEQIPYVDAWGRTQSTGDTATRAFRNFISPAYVGENNSTAVDSELQRLYDAGQGDVLPKQPGKDTKIGDTTLGALPKEKYTEYVTTKGRTQYELVGELFNSPKYQKMDDDGKAAAVKAIYDYATGKAKLAVDPDCDVAKWIARASNKSDPLPTIIGDHSK